MTYTLDEIREKNLIIFETISGSRAYGTSLPISDTDIRGVFVQPIEDIIRYGFVEQVSDAKNDITFYELNKFISLLENNKADVIEYLSIPEEFIIHKGWEWELILSHKKELITKICRYSFGGFAMGQVKKATGYNKKMNWEKSKMKRKNVLDFCYVLINNGTMPFKEWIDDYNKNTGQYKRSQEHFALSSINHTKGIFALYDMYDGTQQKFGIVRDEKKSNDIQLLSLPKDRTITEYLFFNKDAYSVHCREYREYAEWIEKRNKDRFKLNQEHGKQYDSKNMMHTFRMLYAGISLAENPEKFSSFRTKDEITILMKIRNGDFEYSNLIKSAESLIKEMDEKIKNSDLPEKVDESLLQELKWKIRKRRYNLTSHINYAPIQ